MSGPIIGNYKITFGGDDGVSTHAVRCQTARTCRATVEALMTARCGRVKVNGTPAVLWLVKQGESVS